MNSLKKYCALKLFVLAGFICLNLVTALNGQSLTGQLSGWVGVHHSDSFDTWFNAGLRYLPEFAAPLKDANSYMIDLEFSANVYGSFNTQYDSSTSDTKPYRMWIRVATNKFESRLGLQKINFGPAKLLRSLMWFDRLDPRDPLQVTEGVYALRLRYDFENLSSIWLWGLYGEDETKGLETFPSKSGSAEYGGRLQYPLGQGEIGLTYHHRRVVQPTSLIFPNSRQEIPENRIALDGIWDVGIGVWFESALIHSPAVISSLEWQSFLTVGTDYTFAIGNGVHILGEHMIVTVSDQAYDWREGSQTSGVTLSYPLGWLDQVALYSIYNWGMELAYHYISWQRTYDKWVLHLSLFGRVGDSAETLREQQMTLVGKYGLQLMVIFNH